MTNEQNARMKEKTISPVSKKTKAGGGLPWMVVPKAPEEPSAAPISSDVPEETRTAPQAEKPIQDILLSSQENTELAVPLSAESIRLLTDYASLLKSWNERMNLTGITDEEGIAVRHFLDSLTLVSFIEDEMIRQNRQDLTLIDVGTGAGFPGIPLKVAVPTLQVVLLDSLKKRVQFLETVYSTLELDGISAIHARAEDVGKSKPHREYYDIVTARAVAALPVLAEYCVPLLRVGGIFLAMKGQAEEEVESARKAVVELGATIESVHRFLLPGTEMERTIVVIRKLRNTPAKYPRKAGKAQKDPLS